MTDQLDVPFLTKDELRRRANGFLDRTHISGEVPVPIEVIVEKVLQIDIVPVPELQRNFDLDGCTSSDGNIFYVDQWVAERRENRYRFTLAHEIGHLELHRDILQRMCEGAYDIEARAKLSDRMSEALYRSFEWQAYAFAGLVLVPLEPLASTFAQNRPRVRELVEQSEKKGIPRAQVLDYAWEELAAAIAPVFEVSAQVIQKRLDFDGFSPTDL